MIGELKFFQDPKKRLPWTPVMPVPVLYNITQNQCTMVLLWGPDYEGYVYGKGIPVVYSCLNHKLIYNPPLLENRIE